MKHINLYLSAVVLLASLFLFCSFDWKAKPNEELRNDMLSYATSFRDDYKAEPAGRVLRRFVKQQQRETDPYAWIQATHDVVRELKRLYPPLVENDNTPNYSIRSRIFQLLDYPLHVNNTATDASQEELDAYYSSTQQYLNDARRTVLDQVESYDSARHPETKAALWKVYNCGFVIRTQNITMGIDISDRPALPEDYPTWTDVDFSRMAECLDVLFLTHPHDDHFSLPLIKAMIQAGKPVVLPCRFVVPKGNPYSEIVTAINSLPGADTLMRVLDKTYTTPIRIAGIDICSYPGNQGKGIPCNVYWLDLDGFRIIHGGDNYDRNAEEMIASLPAANLILGTSWNEIQVLLTNAMKASGADTAHQLFIPMHENELSHAVDHRESYHELFSRDDRLGNPDFSYPKTLLLDCGESIFIK